MSPSIAERTIEVQEVSKKHDGRLVLDRASFTAKPGKVPAFLGPNGADKSSTLRMLMGLDFPTSGSARFGGRDFRQIRRPLAVVGSVFDGVGGAKSRTARTHLRILAESNGIPRKRVGEVLAQVGMEPKAKSRIGTLSLGEGQRLAIAAAPLGAARGGRWLCSARCGPKVTARLVRSELIKARSSPLILCAAMGTPIVSAALTWLMLRQDLTAAGRADVWLDGGLRAPQFGQLGPSGRRGRLRPRV
ncbi:MAG: ATP-binding cassette domain-containing protein [Bifidobacteriaceae bacterium]|nr:ATP-binding cassette domain-containing protein [Bifidobacteriaceae bacterium]